ncbi:hypothetical protein NK718_02185 [Alsobacter sp. SYSU M60028]|uniref:Uncharacterized protein n=1 Tax=Alsobacter ponti TaxID=2962936 RepID=A0ABT1L7C4_9HYPH|nr:DUF6665 family protein [Alsobacter ponti]MCP8937312.1 hypothetical protein [Alsobacter ponti]
MSLRMPQSLYGGARQQTGVNVLEVEIAQQKAQTLGDLGRGLELALSRLAAFDAQAAPNAEAGPAVDAARAALLDAAADRAWTFMIQRELCGLRNWDAVVKSYAIPRAVLNRMGKVGR